jgi:hypothetical protein
MMDQYAQIDRIEASWKSPRHPVFDPASVVLNMFRNEKGDGANLPERPGGCFAQISPVPFFVARFRQHDTSHGRGKH